MSVSAAPGCLLLLIFPRFAVVARPLLLLYEFSVQCMWVDVRKKMYAVCVQTNQKRGQMTFPLYFKAVRSHIQDEIHIPKLASITMKTAVLYTTITWSLCS